MKFSRLFLALFVVFATVTNLPAQDINGIWQQKLLSGGKWRPVGLFKVDSDGEGHLTMKSIDKNDYDNIIKTNGISAMETVADTWTFKSDWGEGRIADFVLKRKSDDRFEGYSLLDGVRKDVNLWERLDRGNSNNRSSKVGLRSGQTWLGKGFEPDTSSNGRTKRFGGYEMRMTITKVEGNRFEAMTDYSFGSAKCRGVVGDGSITFTEYEVVSGSVGVPCKYSAKLEDGKMHGRWDWNGGWSLFGLELANGQD